MKSREATRWVLEERMLLSVYDIGEDLDRFWEATGEHYGSYSEAYRAACRYDLVDSQRWKERRPAIDGVWRSMSYDGLVTELRIVEVTK